MRIADKCLPLFLLFHNLLQMIEEFIAKLKDQFDLPADSTDIQESTDFKQIEGWDSLVALSIIALADDTYKVKLNGNDISQAKTVKDLYKIIKSRQ